MKITERQLRGIIRESLKELSRDTFVNESLDEHEYWTDPQSGVEYGDDFEPTDNFSDEEIAEMFGLPQDGPSDEDYSESMGSLDDAINEAVGQALKKLGKKAKDAYDKYMDEPTISDVTNGKCSTYGDAQKKGYTRGFNPMKWKN